MKSDDAINALRAVNVRLAMVVYNRALPDMADIDDGPGFWPTLAGCGFIPAGGVLILRRARSGVGAIPGRVRFRDTGCHGLLGFPVIIGARRLIIAAPELAGIAL